jgi:hypothetical protein
MMSVVAAPVHQTRIESNVDAAHKSEAHAHGKRD